MDRRRHILAISALAALSLVVTTACSSSSGSKDAASANASASPGGSAASNVAERTIKVGVLTSLTGILQATFGNDTVEAARARIDLANATDEIPGVKLELVTADDTGTPEGALAAAQQLISEGVTEMIVVSAFFYAAQPYVTAHNIPVMGLPLDPSWGNSKNQDLFATWGSPDENYPTFTGIGDYFKQQGGTKFCGVAIAQDPASEGGVTELAASAKLGGLTVPYLNTSTPDGTTDFTSIAVQMKNAGCDTLGESLATNSTLSLLAALKDQGVKLKASFIAGGYAQNLLDDPTARAEIQGQGMGSQFEPTSLNTPGTIRMMNAMKQYAGYSEPNLTEGQIYGWFSADLAVEGLKVAGSDLSPGSIVTHLRQVTNYDYDGLTCPVNFSKFAIAESYTAATCTWIATAEGDKFVSATGMTPIQLDLVPGTVNKYS
jgi:branched-chain amino acid transport system substrate-binding protein